MLALILNTSNVSFRKKKDFKPLLKQSQRQAVKGNPTDGFGSWASTISILVFLTCPWKPII